MEVGVESKWMKIFPYCWLNWIALQLYTNSYSTSALMLSFIRFRQWSTFLFTNWTPHSGAEKCSPGNSLEAHRRSREKSEIYYLFSPLALLLCVKSYFICRRTYLQKQKQTETRNKNKKLFVKQIYGIDFLLRSLRAIQFRLKYSRKHVNGWRTGCLVCEWWLCVSLFTQRVYWTTF